MNIHLKLEMECIWASAPTRAHTHTHTLQQQTHKCRFTCTYAFVLVLAPFRGHDLRKSCSQSSFQISLTLMQTHARGHAFGKIVHASTSSLAYYKLAQYLHLGKLPLLKLRWGCNVSLLNFRHYFVTVHSRSEAWLVHVTKPCVQVHVPCYLHRIMLTVGSAIYLLLLVFSDWLFIVLLTLLYISIGIEL